MTVALIDQARAVLHEAEADPGRALEKAAGVARMARRQHDVAAASVAEHAYGLASLHVVDAQQAIKHLRVSAGLARRAGDEALVVEALRRLAALLNVAGRPQAALREIDSLVAATHGLEQARAEAQRGAILLQLDRLDAAYDSLSHALPVLRAREDQMWVKRVLSNRGIVQARRFQFAAAHTDFLDARRLNEELGIELSVAFLDQNLGWLETLRGDVPRALKYLDRAEQTMRRLGAQTGFVLEDKARLLVSVGLLDEARDAAEQSVSALQREGQHIAVPDLHLLLATIALHRGDGAIAVAEAQRAGTLLRRLDRGDTAALARYIVAAGRAAAGVTVSSPALERTADQLEAAGWREVSTQAYLLLGELAAKRGSQADAVRYWARAARHRRYGPATLRALAWLAEAHQRRLTGRPSAALSAARAGLNILDRQRATLGAEELRVSTGRHRFRLSQMGLDVALESGKPDRVLTWAEQGRASALTLPPVRSSPDDTVTADLAELRAVTLDIEAAMRSGTSPTLLVSRQTSIERRIRQHVRRQNGDGGDAEPVVSTREVVERLGEAILVEYAVSDGELYAVSVNEARSTLHSLGPVSEVRSLWHRWRFGVRRAACFGDIDVPLQRLLADAATRLERLLLDPVAGILGDRPLVLVPTADLQGLPWPVLPSCHGRAITIAPSATSWYRATGPIADTGTGPQRVVVVAGPGLPGAQEEALAVASLYATTPILPPHSTVVRAMNAIAGADLAHLAAHFYVHPEHALFSSLTLADGPLTGYDLAQAPSMPPVVVLAGCATAQDHIHPGAELLGFASTLLSRGARQIIATVAPVPDTSTASLMVRFHQHLRAGVAAADALAAAQAELIDTAYVTAASFVCIGGTDLG